MSADDATQKLQEKKTQEAIAATQPSNLTNADVARMENAIQQLIAQNAQLAATVANLQQQLQQVQANQGGNQVAAPTAGQSFVGETEARVGMTMGDLKRLPNVHIEMLSENTGGTLYKVCTGKIDDYGQRQVDDLPSTIYGPKSHLQSVVVGSHPAKVQQVLVDATTGKVIEVEAISN
jgi:hypothetical protein